MLTRHPGSATHIHRVQLVTSSMFNRFGQVRGTFISNLQVNGEQLTVGKSRQRKNCQKPFWKDFDIIKFQSKSVCLSSIRPISSIILPESIKWVGIANNHLQYATALFSSAHEVTGLQELKEQSDQNVNLRGEFIALKIPSDSSYFRFVLSGICSWNHT